MVKVLKNNNIFRCRCYTCKSVLEYQLEDKRLVPVGPRTEEYMITCPACGNNTKLDDTEDTDFLYNGTV